MVVTTLPPWLLSENRHFMRKKEFEPCLNPISMIKGSKTMYIYFCARLLHLNTRIYPQGVSEMQFQNTREISHARVSEEIVLNIAANLEADLYLNGLSFLAISTMLRSAK